MEKEKSDLTKWDFLFILSIAVLAMIGAAVVLSWVVSFADYATSIGQRLDHLDDTVQALQEDYLNAHSSDGSEWTWVTTGCSTTTGRQ